MNPKIKDLWLKGRDDEKDIRKKNRTRTGIPISNFERHVLAFNFSFIQIVQKLLIYVSLQLRRKATTMSLTGTLNKLQPLSRMNRRRHESCLGHLCPPSDLKVLGQVKLSRN